MKTVVGYFCIVVVLVFGCATTVMANQPPGPGVSLPQILMLPLMALFTAFGGAYSILRSEQKSKLGKAGKWAVVAFLFLFGFTHEFASMLVTCVFGAMSIYHYFRFAVLEVSSVAVPGLDHAEFLSG